jgi:hypothetical protein
MPRHTHPRHAAKHSRRHTRAQAQRWRERRLRRALESDPWFALGHAGRAVKIEPARAPHAWRYRAEQQPSAELLAHLDRINAELDSLREQLEAYGQRGPLYHVPSEMLLGLDRHARAELAFYMHRPARIEQLDQRGRYERLSEEWGETPRTHPARRVRERRAWEADSDDDLTGQTAARVAPHRPRSRRRCRHGRHQFSDWRLLWYGADRVCEHCGYRESERLNGRQLLRRRAEQDYFSDLRIWQRLYGDDEDRADSAAARGHTQPR